MRGYYEFSHEVRGLRGKKNVDKNSLVSGPQIFYVGLQGDLGKIILDFFGQV